MLVCYLRYLSYQGYLSYIGYHGSSSYLKTRDIIRLVNTWFLLRAKIINHLAELLITEESSILNANTLDLEAGNSHLDNRLVAEAAMVQGILIQMYSPQARPLCQCITRLG